MIGQMMDVSNVLSYLMKKQGLSENKLARDSGVPQPSIHRILTGDVQDPMTKTIKPLADYFKITVAQLRGEAPIETFVYEWIDIIMDEAKAMVEESPFKLGVSFYKQFLKYGLEAVKNELPPADPERLAAVRKRLRTGFELR